MPRRTNLFQKLAYLIHEQIPNAIRVTESAILVDRVSGLEREVDILVELDQPYRLNIGIECIAKSRKADVTWVEQMYAKHQHLTDKVILLSQRGFYVTANDWQKCQSFLAFRNGTAYHRGADGSRLVKRNTSNCRG